MREQKEAPPIKPSAPSHFPKELALLLLGVFAFYLLPYYSHLYHTSRIINEQELAILIKKGYVERVVLCPEKKWARVEIKDKAQRRKSPFRQDRKGKRKITGRTYSYYLLPIVSEEIFDRHYIALQERLSPSQRSSYEVDDQIDLFELFQRLLKLLVLFFCALYAWEVLNRNFSEASENGLFNIGRSRALFWGEEKKVRTTFGDVAGMKEVKQEVREIIDFLKHPEKYINLGAKIPKGVLLVGPPGTGKTLLAKAVAGEAGVPFLSTSGSDFVEMFVGVGPSRVRDLFQQARKYPCCIIFIDEIDAVGQARGRLDGNDERKNTLNALLTEMDGFESMDKEHLVIVIAATNRGETLDAALQRPGRFDRRIYVDRPDIEEREEIFLVHLRRLALGQGVAPRLLAEQTPGFTGADIANVCNEAALCAGRRDRLEVLPEDFEEALDRVIGGLEKKTNTMSAEVKTVVAYHEAGHVVASWFLPHAAPLVKVTIVQRRRITTGGQALGYAQYLPKEDAIYQKEQLLDEVCVLLAARAAEELLFGTISTGAADDLQRVTRMLYSFVKDYGMSSELCHLSFHDPQQDTRFQRPYAERTAEQIDRIVYEEIQRQYTRALELLSTHLEALKKVGELLLKKETLLESDVKVLIGPRPTVGKIKTWSAQEATRSEKSEQGEGQVLEETQEGALEQEEQPLST